MVDNVGVYVVENLVRSFEGINDGIEIRGKENDIGSRMGSIGSIFDSNISVSFFE